LISPSSHRIFISHASRDRKMANTLCQSLESRGLNCWIATRDIEPSEAYQDAIVSALEECSVMVLVFSNNANNSQEIKKEIALASQYLIPVIPVRIEDVLPQGGYQYELANRQWIDLFQDWEGSIDRIVQRVNRTAPDEAARPGAKAVERGTPKSFFGSRNRVRLGLLIAVLAAAAIGTPGLLALLRGAGPSDPPALYPEIDATRLSGFTMETGPQEVKPGVRLWDRVTPDRWRETYPDESVSFSKVVGRSHVGDCDGTIVERVGGSLQSFLPDKGCSTMTFFFRFPPSPKWVEYLPMENVR